ncbi:unnamed protein product [Boreogadus saida]
MSGPTALASSVPRCKWRPGRSTSLPNTEKESRVRSADASVPCTRCLSRREEREEDRRYQQSPQQSTTHQLLNPAREVWSGVSVAAWRLFSALFVRSDGAFVLNPAPRRTAHA